ncbi:MAG: DsbA family protein [Beijerinckiaceae bacterium]
MSIFNRRNLMVSASALGAANLLGTPAQAQDKVFDAAELAVAGPLGDKVQGKADAPVICYEYASLTCGHCAAFHANGFKHLKEKYIDTGKVRYVLREFAFDPLAAAGFMLSHCGGDNKYFPIVDLLFAQQDAWARSAKPVEALLSLMKQAGFTQESFEACLKNQSIYDGVNAVRARGSEKFGVDSTPTFFFNGRKSTGALNAAQLDAIIEPLLKT